MDKDSLFISADVTEWLRRMAPDAGDTPFYNYTQTFNFSMPDPYAGALIGYRKARHPILSGALRPMIRALLRAENGLIGLAGYQEAGYWEEDGRFVEHGGGVVAFRRLLQERELAWRERTPIYDEAIVAANKALIAAEAAARPKVTWGRGTPDPLPEDAA